MDRVSSVFFSFFFSRQLLVFTLFFLLYTPSNIVVEKRYELPMLKQERLENNLMKVPAEWYVLQKNLQVS